MEAPEKIYLLPRQGGDYAPYWRTDDQDSFGIEYTRTDAIIERVINFLSYKLDDIVTIRVPGTIISHHVAKQELIEDLKKFMKGE